MPKTYGTVTTFTAGSVLTAAQLNTAGTAINNLVVPAAVQVVRTSNLTVTSGAAVTWSQSVIDTDSMFTSGTAITVGTTGIYSVMFRGYLASSGTMTNPVAFVNVNGTDILQQYLPQIGANAIFCLAGQISLTATQIVTASFSFAGTGTFALAGAASDSSQRGTLSLTWIGRTS